MSSATRFFLLAVLPILLFTLAGCSAKQPAAGHLELINAIRTGPTTPADALIAREIDAAESYFFQLRDLRSELKQERLACQNEPRANDWIRYNHYEYSWKREYGDRNPTFVRRALQGNRREKEILLPADTFEHIAPGYNPIRLRISPSEKRLAFVMQPVVEGPRVLLVISPGPRPEIEPWHVGPIDAIEWLPDETGILVTHTRNGRPTTALLVRANTEALPIYNESIDSNYLHLLADKNGQNRALFIKTLEHGEVIPLNPATLLPEGAQKKLIADSLLDPVLAAGCIGYLKQNSLIVEQLSKSVSCSAFDFTSPDPDSTHIAEFDLFSGFAAIVVRDDLKDSFVIARGSGQHHPFEGETTVGTRYQLRHSPSINPAYLRLSKLEHNGIARLINLDTKNWKSQTAVRANGSCQPPEIQLEQRTIVARDAEIPLSIFSPLNSNQIKRGVIRVYGAYGKTLTPEISSWDYQLLNRGISILYAHIPGGGFKGKKWHTAGMGKHKPRSLSAFQEVVRSLAAEGWRLVIDAKSAGGIVSAYVTASSPELVAGLLLDAPFLDPEAALSNPTLPHFDREKAEWGDPELISSFKLLKEKLYPEMLISVRTADRLVPARETFAWVYLIRELNRSSTRIVLLPHYGSDHLGPTSAADRFELKVSQLAFVINLLGA